MEVSFSEVDLQERCLDERAISQAVHAICKKVLGLILTDPKIYLELGEKFEPALSDLIGVEIGPLDIAQGSFRVVDGTLTLNEPDIARLMSYVIDDMKRQVTMGRPGLEPGELREILVATTSLFALHELRHRTQGVEKFSTVQLLKKIDGREQIAKFDIQADRDAAVALAAAHAGEIGTKDFLAHYQRALFYSVEYFFKIYPANVDRPDKICRVAAMLFMLARLEIYRTIGTLSLGSPMTAISVSIAPDHRSIAIFENEPRNKLITASNDVVGLPQFISDIETGRLEEALGSAFAIAISIGLG